MPSYVFRHLAQALLSIILLAVACAVVAGGCSEMGCSQPLTGAAILRWLIDALRLNFGTSLDATPVTTAITTATPATALLVGAAMACTLVVGWGGGCALALAGWPDGQGGRVARLLTGLGRLLAALAAASQALPTFWVGGLLVAICSVALGWLPPGGIVAADLPAFGTAAYAAALAAHPGPILGDLLGHLTLPAITLTLASLATDLRLIRATLPAQLWAPHTRVARGAGLSRQRLIQRAARPAVAGMLGGSAAGAALQASALVLVEYLFGWPGLGLLAYHAARAGDGATLGALLLLFGVAVITWTLAADIVAAWADPRLRR